MSDNSAFEPDFNAAWLSAVGMQSFLNDYVAGKKRSILFRLMMNQSSNPLTGKDDENS